MGDRFYEQQIAAGKASKKGNKPKRRLKADIVKTLNAFFGKELSSLSNMTIPDLEYVEEFLKDGQ